MEPPRRTASPPAAALRTLLLGAVACACSEPARPAASSPAAATSATRVPPSAATAAATQTSAPASTASTPSAQPREPAPAAPSSAPPSPTMTASTAPARLPDGCREARGLRRSALKGERRDASGVSGCVDAVDGHCCGPAGGGMACARPFDRGTTLRLRSAGHAGICCYAMGGDEVCEGRPLYVDGVLRRATLQSRADWSRAS